VYVRVQLVPPSSERKNPPSSPPASTSAYTFIGFAREIDTPIFPTMTFVGRPLVSFCQVFPPSVDRNMPPSVLPESIDHGDRCVVHMAAISVFGFFMSIVTSMAPVRSLM
jgi:hypothetical protein